jgi:hypothetical protein
MSSASTSVETANGASGGRRHTAESLKQEESRRKMDAGGPLTAYSTMSAKEASLQKRLDIGYCGSRGYEDGQKLAIVAVVERTTRGGDCKPVSSKATSVAVTEDGFGRLCS